MKNKHMVPNPSPFNPNKFRYSGFSFIINDNVDKYTGDQNYSTKLQYTQDEVKNVLKEMRDR